MTFFKVNDPKNRELIKEVIAKRAVIREADRRRKMGDALEFEQLSRFFKPITQQTEKSSEKLEKGIGELPGKIARVLPRPVNILPQPPPPPQPGQLQYEQEEDEEEKLDEAAGGEEDFPKFVKETTKGYEIGDVPLKINHDYKIIYTAEKTINSDKIYDFLTNNKSKVTWDDLDEKEQNDLGILIVDSNILYENKKTDNIRSTQRKEIRREQNNRWNNVFSHIWYNRFLYMDEDRLNTPFEKNQMKKSYQNKDVKKLMTTDTIQLINNVLGQSQGRGLKKNYITLPSNPIELIERLELLSGSKDAGNTGVYNEIVSICDELLKKKIIGKGQYKQFLSNIKA